jgi:hypothetical protein
MSAPGRLALALPHAEFLFPFIPQLRPLDGELAPFLLLAVDLLRVARLERLFLDIEGAGQGLHLGVADEPDFIGADLAFPELPVRKGAGRQPLPGGHDLAPRLAGDKEV